MLVEKVPPDGGYGWVIVLAAALSNIIVIPLMQSFGLIFKDTFKTMGLSATEGSLIINLNAAFGMIMGLINGVLLKVYGYRRVAFLASSLVVVGIVLTSFATTFTHFIITYGLITSLGMGMNMSAYSLAVNSYFKKNRSKAMSYTMTMTGFGPILMPQLINILTETQTIQGVTLILGGISTHCFLAATLLQPLKWHMKTILKDEDKQEDDKAELNKNPSQESDSDNESVEDGPVFGMDSAFTGSVISLYSTTARRPSTASRLMKKESLQNVNRRESVVYNPDLSYPIKKKSFWNRLIKRLVNFFDLDLFKDPIYISIMVGMSLAIFAELNFSLLTAFILADLGLNTLQIATFMSVLGISDLILRFLAPHVAALLGWSARQVYTGTLFLLMATRFLLLISNNYYVLLGVALGLGIAKGIRTIYMSLVIPSYVPIEKLASASGIQMMVNGICILIGGPIIGVIRDATGSYSLCIVVLNCITFSTVVLWTVEAIVVKYKKIKSEKTVEMTEQTNTLLKS